MRLTTMFLLSTYFIYRSKHNNSLLSIGLFLEKCKRAYQIERFIARRNKKLLLHNKIWEPLPFSNNSYHFLSVSKL